MSIRVPTNYDSTVGRIQSSPSANLAPKAAHLPVRGLNVLEQSLGDPVSFVS